MALCLCLVLAGCGGGDSSGGSTASASGSSTEARLTKPVVHVPHGAPPKKLVERELRKGSGTVAGPGDEVTVQYVGVKYEDGKQVDTSWGGQPLSTELGSGSLIPGWETGLVGMKVGGRRELIIPSHLAYGSGALVFVIDLLAVKDPQALQRKYAQDPIANRSKPKIEVPKGPPPEELVVNDLKKGTGAAVKPGDKIIVSYVGVNYKTGKEFESTWNGAGVAGFQLGKGEVIEGWEAGMIGMRVGARRELIIPSRLAFGKGAVVYVIDLVAVEKQ